MFVVSTVCRHRAVGGGRTQICSASSPVGLWELEARASPHWRVQEIQGLAKLLDAMFQDQKRYIWTVSTMQGTKRTKELG